VRRALDSISAYFLVVIFELNLIAVKLMQEEVLVYLLQSYRDAHDVALYSFLELCPFICQNSNFSA
jgi:hypothetical protein